MYEIFLSSEPLQHENTSKDVTNSFASGTICTGSDSLWSGPCLSKDYFNYVDKLRVLLSVPKVFVLMTNKSYDRLSLKSKSSSLVYYSK